MTPILSKPNKQISLEIRQHLGKKLTDAWRDNKYQKYLVNLNFNDSGSEAGILKELSKGIGDDHTRKQEAGLAFYIWKIMQAEDRLAVIHTFVVLFDQLLHGYTQEQKTLIFSKVFLKEFVPVIIQHCD